MGTPLRTIVPRTFTLLAIALTLCGAWGDARALVTFTGLGHAPGALTSRAYAISSDGSVVVGSGYLPNSALSGFRWSAASGLATVSGLTQATIAYSVSGDGAIVGGYTESLIDAKAYVWTPSAGATLLFSRGTLWSGSSDGSVFAGDEMDGGTHQHHAVRWSASGGMRSLEPHGVVLGYSRAFGVSGDGTKIVGDAVFPGFGYTRAFLWTDAAGMVNIGSTNPAIGSSRADAISADGTTVVGTAQAGPTGNTVAFRWTAAGGMQGLADFTVNSEALGVSADGGTIVGTRGGEAFVWRADLGLVPLATLLGDAAAGWHLTEARAVSADGSVIAGSGTNPSGQTEAWRAELPLAIAGVEPGAGASFAVRAFPNPAHGDVVVRASGMREATGEATILDVSGRVVRVLPSAAAATGDATWRWDGRANDGRAVAPGVYLVRVRSGGDARVTRLLRVE